MNSEFMNSEFMNNSLPLYLTDSQRRVLSRVKFQENSKVGELTWGVRQISFFMV